MNLMSRTEILVFLAIMSYIFLAFIYFIFFRKSDYVLKEVEERHSSILVNKKLRYFWIWFFEPIFKILYFLQVSPDILTISSVIITAFASILLAWGEFVWGAFVLAIASTFDVIDGRLARATGETKRSGDYLDSSLDRIADTLVFLGLLYFFRNDTFMFIVISIALFSTVGFSYFRAKAEALGVNNNVGMMQRPERMWVICGAAVFSSLIPILLAPLNIVVETLSLFKLALVFLAFSTLLSCMYRLINGYIVLKINDMNVSKTKLKRFKLIKNKKNIKKRSSTKIY